MANQEQESQHLETQSKRTNEQRIRDWKFFGVGIFLGTIITAIYFRADRNEPPPEPKLGKIYHIYDPETNREPIKLLYDGHMYPRPYTIKHPLPSTPDFQVLKINGKIVYYPIDRSAKK